MSASTTTSPVIASTSALVRAVAAVEYFKRTGEVPAWAKP